MVSGDTMRDDRTALFDALEKEATAALSLINISTPEFTTREHNLWVWNATAQPTGSHYFPVYIDLIRALEQSGEINPDEHILVETTTGSAGASFAEISKRLGYECIVLIPEDMPKRRIEALRAALPDTPNSQVHYSPSGQYIKGLVASLRRFLVRNKNGIGGKKIFAVDHSRREESSAAIKKAVSQTLSQLPPDTHIDKAVVALGNGTSASGVKHALDQHSPSARLTGIEPLEAPSFFIKKYGEDRFTSQFGSTPRFHTHGLLGTGGWGVDFPLMNIDELDDIQLVAPETWQAQRTILSNLGFNVGNSSAACFSIVQQMSLLTDHQPCNFFSIFYDLADRY